MRLAGAWPNTTTRGAAKPAKGQPKKAGQTTLAGMVTGSCTGTVLVAPGTVVVADFPGLGRAELQLG